MANHLHSLLLATAIAAASLPGAAVVNYVDYDTFDYSQFTYTWKDASGVSHTSSINDVATDPAQIRALTWYVYQNRNIPGTYHIPSSFPATGDTVFADIAYQDVALDENRQRYTIPYSGTNVWSPNKEGVTAFVVRLKDEIPLK